MEDSQQDRASCSINDTLPPEALALVFRYYLSSAPRVVTFSGGDSTAFTQLTPLAVCRKWRDISLQFPECWDDIHAGLHLSGCEKSEQDRRTTFVLSELKLRFDHAKNRAVNLTMDMALDVRRQYGHQGANANNSVQLGLLYREKLPRLRSYAETGDDGYFLRLIGSIPERVYQDTTKLRLIDKGIDMHVLFPPASEGSSPTEYRFPALQHLCLVEPTAKPTFHLLCPQLRSLALTGPWAQTDKGTPQFLLETIMKFPLLETVSLDIDLLHPMAWKGAVPFQQHPQIQTLVLDFSSVWPSFGAARRSIVPLCYFMKSFPKLSTVILTDITLLSRLEILQPKPLSELRILSSTQLPFDFKDKYPNKFTESCQRFLADLQVQHLHLGDCGDEGMSWPSLPVREIIKEDLEFFLNILGEHCAGLQDISIHNTRLDAQTLSFLGAYLRRRWQPGEISSTSECRLLFRNCTFSKGLEERPFLAPPEVDLKTLRGLMQQYMA
jgi:hypothetical protein